MNWLDVVLLIVLVWSIAASFRKGLTREILGLATAVAALLLSLWFYGTAGSFFVPYLSSRGAANLVGFLAVFGGVMLLGSVVSFALGKFLKVTGLSIVDHLLGAAFGALRGTMVAVGLIMAIMAFAPAHKPPDSVVHSRVAPYVARASRLVAMIAPHDLRESFRNTYDQVRAAWGELLDHGHGKPPGSQRNNDERKF
ncbi:MAG TPA: CvpA family protein [Bryobacteraceae bacterium]|nr:CvpA family protein [Bryobacteraceae bacterium]